MHDMAADAVRPPQQRFGLAHVTGGQRGAHGRAGDTQAVHLVTHHAGDVEAVLFLCRGACGVEHRVVACTLGAEAEIVAHQHVARAQATLQNLGDEGLRRHRREGIVKGRDDDLVDAAAFELGEFVAQRGDAHRRGFGPAGAAREVVARVRLEGQHAARQAAVAGLAG